MERWDLKIELRSDFCTPAGESAPGIINCKTALVYGIPYIPAKRIKGCLLEAAREMADNGVIQKEALARIFGCPGMGRAEGIRVSDGHLSSVPGYLLELDGDSEDIQAAIEDYEAFQESVIERPEIEPALLEEIFTRTRTRTALEEETGAAKKHSLRTIQAVPSGVVFTSRLEGALGQEDETVLQMCAKGLRHMGLGVTRGMGEVHCSLKRADSDETACHKQGMRERYGGLLHPFSSEEEVCLPYEITLRQPVVIAGFSEEHTAQIPASAVMGSLAGMYIRKYSLGDKAHEDDAFSRIFLRDGVQFGNAFLKKGKIRYLPCPKAFAIPKDDRTSWFNILKDDADRRRKSISKHIELKESYLYMAAPEKEIHFHHARPADRGIGHALNDRAQDTSEPTGQFFQYTALSKGQTFAGTIKGAADDIQKLVECLEENQYRLMLGRSRTAEYGDCEIHFEEPKRVNQMEGASKKEKEWLVWLLSPLVYRNQDNGLYQAEGDCLRRQMEKELGNTVSVAFEKSICGSTVISGYNNRWNLPQASCSSLAPGSSFYVKTGEDVEAWQIEGKRWGLFTGKGCGEVKVMPWKDSLEGKIADQSRQALAENQEKKDLPAQENKMITAILTYQENCVKWKDDAEKALKAADGQDANLPSSSHIVLLIQLLNANRGMSEFYERVKKEVERISGDEKRERILKFIEPCADQTIEFMRQYLEAAKWKARRRE